jgi:hypothetical protein
MNWHECLRPCLYGRLSQPNQTVGYDMEPQRPVPAQFVARVARAHLRGAGSMSLLFTAEEWGFTPAGLDLREANVRALIKLGHALPQNHGFRPVEYHISEPYRLCMEVIAIKQG